MKYRHLLPLLGLALPLAVKAVPADPTPMVVTNPDGTTITIVNHGDERFHYYTQEGTDNIIGYDHKTGFWRPEVRNGRELKAESADLQMLRQEFQAYMLPEMIDGNTRMAMLDSEGRTTYPTLGDVRSLVVLMEYKDVKFGDYSKSRYDVKDIRDEIDKKLNQEGYSNFNSVGSARDYYLQNSHGLFHPQFDVTRVVSLPETSAYYTAHGIDGLPAPGTSGRFTEAIQYAILELDDEIDFSQYDYDNDGKIDNIFFYYAGFGQADSNQVDVIWPHQADYQLVVNNLNYYPNLNISELIVDGKMVSTYACANELKGARPASMQPWLDGIGTFCHEYGHVLGYPDFYDIEKTGTEVPENFDLMCSGSYNNGSTMPPALNAYERWVCRWLEYDLIEKEDETYELPALTSSNKAYRLSVPRRGSGYYPNEYFIFECRANESWDQSLPDHGLTIYHVRYNKNAWQTAKVNVKKDPRFRIVRPLNFAYDQFCWDESTPYLYPGTSASLAPIDNVSPYFRCFLTGIGYDEATQTARFTYNHVTSRPEDVVRFTCGASADELDRDVFLYWYPVEGATDYLLTAYYTRTGGERVYINNLNERSIGNVTEYVIRKLTSPAWNAQTTVTVRAVVEIPSVNTSEALTFVPKELPDHSAVSELPADEVPVIGVAGGCILAPEDAKVFNMSGVETGRNGLAPGIYVVKTGNYAVKVVVK